MGIDGFRALTEQYMGKPMEPWVPLPEVNEQTLVPL